MLSDCMVPQASARWKWLSAITQKCPGRTHLRTTQGQLLYFSFNPAPLLLINNQGWNMPKATQSALWTFHQLSHTGALGWNTEQDRIRALEGWFINLPIVLFIEDNLIYLGNDLRLEITRLSQFPTQRGLTVTKYFHVPWLGRITTPVFKSKINNTK